MKRRSGLSAKLALIAALTGCVFASAASAAGAVISFSGAVVPSSYGVLVSSTATAKLARGGLETLVTEIRFLGSSSGAQSATVRVEWPDREPVPMRCGGGMQPAPPRGCVVGVEGGSLTLATLDSSRASARPVVAVVITTYD
jgi:hypothetical protein